MELVKYVPGYMELHRDEDGMFVVCDCGFMRRIFDGIVWDLLKRVFQIHLNECPNKNPVFIVE